MREIEIAKMVEAAARQKLKVRLTADAIIPQAKDVIIWLINYVKERTKCTMNLNLGLNLMNENLNFRLW